MFILLTNEDDEKVYVNVDKICYFQKSEDIEDHEPVEVTEIGFVGGESIFVKESVENISKEILIKPKLKKLKTRF